MLMRYKSLWRALHVLSHRHYSNNQSPAVGVNVGLTSASSGDRDVPKASEISGNKSPKDDKTNSNLANSSKKLVSAAFNSLKESNDSNAFDSKIASAETVESLLFISEINGLARNHALKIVSKLADWTSEGKVKLKEFDGDPRFIKLCQVLGHQVSTRPRVNLSKKELSNLPTPFSDLGVVLGVAGDDEAAKLVNTITVPQMIKVLSSLAYKKRRSIPLLRSLAFNIGKSSDKLNIKDCADILYGCASLSFHDEVLFEKVCSDLCDSIMTNEKPAVVGSIVTSLGLLKYKDKDLLDLLCEWVVINFAVCRIQDLTTLVLTLASVNHLPSNEDILFKKLESHLVQSDLASPVLWLDIVWALVILDKANNDNHLSSVLCQEFIDRLANSQKDGLSIVSKLKLLNINGAAKTLANNYAGPFLEADSYITKIDVPRSKDKLTLVGGVVDTMSNLLPSALYMKTNINTGMGYIIDGECVVDKNLIPMPLVDKKTGKYIDRVQPGVRKGTKIAILVLDYHDVTKGETGPVGIASLAIRLTQKSGYKVITVPHYDFNPKDKLVTRVQYLEQQLKECVKNFSSQS